MKTFSTGNPVRNGVYFNHRPLDICFVGSDGEILDGHPGASYIRVPSLLALAFSPVLGGLFVALFPVLIFGSLAVLIGQTISEKLGSAVRQQASLLRMQGAPAASYLNRENEDGEPTEVDELASLEDEVKAAREDEDAS